MLKNFILTPKGQFATAFGTGIVLTIVSAVISNASAPDYAVTLRLSHDRVAGSIADLSAYKFKELIEENSGGKVTVAIYPNNGLSAGDQQKAVEMLKDGAIDIQICSATDLYELDPRFGTFWLPFLFDSEEQAAFFASDATVAETIQSWLTPHNLDLLTMHTTGALELSNNTREIDSPADLEGLKIRVAPSDFAGEVMSRLGAEPVELDFSEVPHALEQGEIQGLTSNLALYLSSKLYESQPYLTLWNGMYDIQVWVANEENLGKLDDQLKTAFTKSLTETVTWQHNLFTEFKKLYLKTLEQKGVTITTLTDGERIAFREKVKPIYHKYIEALGNDTLLFFLSHRGHDADQVEPLVPIEYNLQKNAEAAAEETVEALKEVTGEQTTEQAPEQAPAEPAATTPAETAEPAAEPAAEATAPVAEETP
ncbi:MAG TPA: TRAP transporter substrate-binding protein DctP, partial [Candidatus Anaerobiospirillum stercoravium]|nr:TRAP transporter substrate-binding protein DctP [Candidatus Anaerobiospirillum stercoravium]